MLWGPKWDSLRVKACEWNNMQLTLSKSDKDKVENG